MRIASTEDVWVLKTAIYHQDHQYVEEWFKRFDVDESLKSLAREDDTRSFATMLITQVFAWRLEEGKWAQGEEWVLHVLSGDALSTMESTLKDDLLRVLGVFRSQQFVPRDTMVRMLKVLSDEQ